MVFETLDFSKLEASDSIVSALERATAKDPSNRPSAAELEVMLSSPVVVPDSSPTSTPATPPSVLPLPQSAPLPASPSVAFRPVSAAPSPGGPSAVSGIPPAPVPPGFPGVGPTSYPIASSSISPEGTRAQPTGRKIALAVAIAAAAAIVASIAVAAVVRGGVARRQERAQSSTLPRGFVIHESRLRYRAAVSERWRTELTGPSTEHIVSPGEGAGIAVSVLGKEDPGIYKLGTSELISKVKGSLSFDQGYEVDARTAVANTRATFGGASATSVEFEIAGSPVRPRYKARLYMFNEGGRLWAVVFFGRKAEFDAVSPEFSIFETSFEALAAN